VPHYVELEASVFLSEKGEVSARLEMERDFLFTQELILQPSLELDFHAHDVEEFDVGAAPPHLNWVCACAAKSPGNSHRTLVWSTSANCSPPRGMRVPKAKTRASDF